MDDVFDLLAVLRAAQVSHQHAHWTSKGDEFYGDHLLFERIYNPLADQIDGLAEKAVQRYGDKSVDPCKQLKHMTQCVEMWTRQANLVSRALLVEKAIQSAIESTRESLVKDKKLSIGLDNFLAQLADDHETALYLLGQRNKEG